MVRFLRSSSRIRLTRSYTRAPESKDKQGAFADEGQTQPRAVDGDDGQLINGGL